MWRGSPGQTLDNTSRLFFLIATVDVKSGILKCGVKAFSLVLFPLVVVALLELEQVLFLLSPRVPLALCLCSWYRLILWNLVHLRIGGVLCILV